jgi:hypothetical protein
MTLQVSWGLFALTRSTICTAADFRDAGFNSRFGYVSLSRASHEATLFTDDLTKKVRAGSCQTGTY